MGPEGAAPARAAQPTDVERRILFAQLREAVERASRILAVLEEDFALTRGDQDDGR